MVPKIIVEWEPVGSLTDQNQEINQIWHHSSWKGYSMDDKVNGGWYSFVQLEYREGGYVLKKYYSYIHWAEARNDTNVAIL